ncbi:MULTISPECIES: hypothetical protein [Nostocales]|nr:MULTISPECIES: hypothetical protein [Nostocales]MBD2474153.1 hypothetical protein [Anabaena sp. FACHB-83]MBD2488755.1 hypothetical protein [Aulosira sp. FACHB-615]
MATITFSYPGNTFIKTLILSPALESTLSLIAISLRLYSGFHSNDVHQI